MVSFLHVAASEYNLISFYMCVRVFSQKYWVILAESLFSLVQTNLPVNLDKFSFNN